MLLAPRKWEVAKNVFPWRMPTKKLCSGTQTFGEGSFQIWKNSKFDTPQTPLFFFFFFFWGGGFRRYLYDFTGFEPSWMNLLVQKFSGASKVKLTPPQFFFLKFFYIISWKSQKKNFDFWKIGKKNNFPFTLILQYILHHESARLSIAGATRLQITYFDKIRVHTYRMAHVGIHSYPGYGNIKNRAFMKDWSCVFWMETTIKIFFCRNKYNTSLIYYKSDFIDLW